MDSPIYFHSFRGRDNAPDKYDVIFCQTAYRRISEHVATEKSREVGGLLIGFYEWSNGAQRAKIFIADAVAFPEFKGSIPHRFLHEAERLLRVQHSDVKRIGWYHSHPTQGVFLSPLDIDINLSLTDPLCLALVVCPSQNTGGFYVQVEGRTSFETINSFSEYADLEATSIITWSNLTNAAETKHALPRRGKKQAATQETRAVATRRLRVFLCHSSGDKPKVRDLYTRLSSAASYIAPWLDEEDLLPGQRWEDEIPAAVRTSDVVLVCLSNEAINKSGYVQKEIKDALDVADRQPEGAIFLIPVKLEECQIPNRLSHLQYVNLFEKRGFERLVRSLVFRAESLGIAEAQKDTVEIVTYENKGVNVNLPAIFRRLRRLFTEEE